MALWYSSYRIVQYSLSYSSSSSGRSISKVEEGKRRKEKKIDIISFCIASLPSNGSSLTRQNLSKNTQHKKAEIGIQSQQSHPHPQSRPQPPGKRENAFNRADLIEGFVRSRSFDWRVSTRARVIIYYSTTMQAFIPMLSHSRHVHACSCHALSCQNKHKNARSQQRHIVWGGGTPDW